MIRIKLIVTVAYLQCSSLSKIFKETSAAVTGQMSSTNSITSLQVLYHIYMYIFTGNNNANFAKVSDQRGITVWCKDVLTLENELQSIHAEGCLGTATND